MGMHLNPRMEPQSLPLALHSEDLKKAPLVEPSEVRKLELKQGTKLQLASCFGSTRLKGEGFAAAVQQVEEFATKVRSEPKSE